MRNRLLAAGRIRSECDMGMPDKLSQLHTDISELLDQSYSDEQIVHRMKIPACTRMFSPLRANVMKWIPIKNTDTVLEIGADYGEITGYLCQQSKLVIAFEDDPVKEELIRKRYKHLQNLQFMTGDMQACIAEAQDHHVRYVMIHSPETAFKDKNALEAALKNIKACLPEAMIVFLCCNLFWA